MQIRQALVKIHFVSFHRYSTHYLTEPGLKTYVTKVNLVNQRKFVLQTLTFYVNFMQIRALNEANYCFNSI